MSHVDSPSPVTHVSLCAGCGGIDLGLHRAIRNLRTIAVSEIEAFACANLVAKMEAGLLDPAPIWTDLKTFPWSDFRDRVDILSGGYPCQPFSAAGKRLGAEDPRHLWPFIADGIAAMRPSACFFENVDGHISMGLPDVLQDLAGLGYRATWCVASASECGAPHQRKRVFILAHDQQQGLERLREYCPAVCRPDEGLLAGNGRCGEELALTSSLRSAARIPRPQQGHEGIAGVADDCGDERLANAECVRLTAGRNNARQSQRSQPEHCCAWPSRPGEQQHAWEPPRVVLANASDNGRAAREAGGRVCGEQPDARRQEESEGVEQSSGSGAFAGVLANPTSTGSGSEGGDTVYQGWSSSDAWATSVSQDAEWQAGAAIADDQSAGRDGAELGNAASPRCPRPEDTGADCGDEGQGTWREESERAGAMGHPNSPRPQERPRQRAAGIQGADADGGETAERQTQPPLGRDADGPADWLDDAELYTTCDNRTDELRLLGNGVVPACAERAFRLLVGELMEHQP